MIRAERGAGPARLKGHRPVSSKEARTPPRTRHLRCHLAAGDRTGAGRRRRRFLRQDEGRRRGRRAAEKQRTEAPRSRGVGGRSGPPGRLRPPAEGPSVEAGPQRLPVETASG